MIVYIEVRSGMYCCSFIVRYVAYISQYIKFHSCSDLRSEQTCLIASSGYDEDHCLPKHSLPVSRGCREPVACYSKPYYWPLGPHRTEIQVSCLADGNSLPHGSADKARGWSVWSNQEACSDEQEMMCYNVQKLLTQV